MWPMKYDICVCVLLCVMRICAISVIRETKSRVNKSHFNPIVFMCGPVSFEIRKVREDYDCK